MHRAPKIRVGGPESRVHREGSRETFVYRLKFPLAFVKSSAWKSHTNLLATGQEGNKVQLKIK
jgi:hypothetical protein